MRWATWCVAGCTAISFIASSSASLSSGGRIWSMFGICVCAGAIQARVQEGPGLYAQQFAPHQREPRLAQVTWYRPLAEEPRAMRLHIHKSELEPERINLILLIALFLAVGAAIFYLGTAFSVP